MTRPLQVTGAAAHLAALGVIGPGIAGMLFAFLGLGLGLLPIIGIGLLFLLALVYILFGLSWLETARVDGLYGFGLTPRRLRTSGRPGFGGFLRTLGLQIIDPGMWRAIANFAISVVLGWLVVALLGILTSSIVAAFALDVPVEFEGPRPASVGNHVVAEQPDGTRWRTRVSLHVDEDGRVGAFAARSHRVIPTQQLPLATAAIERAAAGLGTPAPGRIDLVQPADGHVRVIPRGAEGTGRGASARRSTDVVVEQVGGRRFRVDAGGFWQVHRLAASTLTSVLTEELVDRVDPDGWHLDLYGGVGLFGALLGDLAGSTARITSVEANERATEHAGENLAEWVGARAETARVDRWVHALRERITDRDRERLSRGTVVLDPPRAGAGAAVVDDLAALAPASIAYVACDPVALARDLARFAGHGYRTDRVRGIDLFPHSHHMEAVVLLRSDTAG